MLCRTQPLTGKRYNSIDLFKFIMAFAVVAIHTHPLEACTNDNLFLAYDLLVSMAVPFFFLASGYLLAVKMHWPYGNECDLARIRTHLKKTTQMYITWTLIYLPLAVHHFITAGTSPSQAVWLYIKGFLFVGEQYNSWHLWYLLSTIYALLLIWGVLKAWKSPKLLILISIIASVARMGCSILVETERDLFPAFAFLKKLLITLFINGRILTGMVYIPIGMLLAYKRIPVLLNWVGLVIGFAANFFVDNAIISSYLLIITSIALFGIVENTDLKDKPIYAKLRTMSTTIYLLHMYIWTFYYSIANKNNVYGIDSFLVTSLVCVVVSLIVVFITEKRKSKSRVGK